ncbi:MULTISPECIES: ribokinase [unclassified Halanaerobium]|uniref:ribokinase n=1 Tax=unclassified Halanaerobium TaxID=2641197 RepID=UPI0011C0807F|nr:MULTISPECIES: ribokinase [unclassified Halanaerobium]
MSKINNIIVIGSLNMDLVASTPRIPEIGETILGTKLDEIPGGKGANQAVSARQAGGKTWMFGKIGRDSYGKYLKENLTKFDIDLEFLIEDEDEDTGTAVISVDEKGNNSIIVIPGANSKLSAGDIEKKQDNLNKFDMMLLQLEIPEETVLKAVDTAAENNIMVVLDPAPVFKLPESIYKKVDIITPNTTEAEQLTGIKVEDEESMNKAADYFLKRGVKIVILTLGSKGLFVKTKKESFTVPGLKVNAVDTTAAGDCFTGTFAAVYDGSNLKEAVEWANTGAAISTTKMGAQTSIPDKEEIKKFLENIKEDK